MSNFYNTLNLPKDLVTQYEQRGNTQKEFIYQLFLINKQLSRVDLLNVLPTLKRNIASSSISRCLTDLKTEGRVMITPNKKEGKHGVKNSIYELINNPGQIKKISNNRNIKLSQEQIRFLKEHLPDCDIANSIKKKLP
jgi:hypothetical protein